MDLNIKFEGLFTLEEHLEVLEVLKVEETTDGEFFNWKKGKDSLTTINVMEEGIYKIKYFVEKENDIILEKYIIVEKLTLQEYKDKYVERMK